MAKAPTRGPPPLHPGEHLRTHVLPSLLGDHGLPKGKFAERLGVSYEVLENLIGGKSNMTPSMALRLATVLGGAPEDWMALQAAYDLEKARVAMTGQLAGLAPLSAGKGKKEK